METTFSILVHAADLVAYTIIGSPLNYEVRGLKA
jgi:hypothetical protein